MRICVDYTSAVGDATGVGTYTRELVRALLAAGGEDELVLAVHAYRHPGWHRRVRETLAGAPGRYEVRPSRLLPHGLVLEANRWLRVPTAEALFGPSDVFHGTNFLAPPRRRARSVVTVHDLAFVRFAGELAVPHRYGRYLEESLAEADRVIAVSEATRRDLLQLAGLPPERVAVVHEGAPARFPTLPEEEFRAVRHRLGIPERYLLFVGTLEPRKNLVRLVEAFLAARPRMGGDPGLVLAGRTGWAAEEILEAVRCGRTRGVVRTGFVPEPLRNSLYAHALAFVLPSIHEGFGLPVLEAFAGGAPVIASDRGSLPEVAGDAALLVHPLDGEALADRIVRAAEDEGLRRDLAARGRARLRLFSWERAARETLEVYRSA